MTTPNSSDLPPHSDDFADAAEEASPGLMREFVDFVRHNKKWWLAPIIIVLLLVAAMILLSGTVAAPFIYTLF